jgi:YidC/Oxa1 family membrane protein insertase
MNNKRSPIEQFFTIALLSFAGFLLWQQFSGNKPSGSARAEKTAPPLAQAFKGLDGGAPSKEAALKEISALQAELETGGKDEYSYWARLRLGLLQQYVLKNAVEARKSYDEVIHRNKNEVFDAQALYQKGDLSWRQGQSETGADGKTQSAEQKAALEVEGAQTLEQFLIRARGHKVFLDNKIFVPDIKSARGDPLSLPAGWEQLTLNQLLGVGSTLPGNTTATGDPRAILTRVDRHYSTTPLYKVFDTVVKWYGANPAYSYGLALITLALVTRLVMQPLIKKQYDSMKGMQLIAPEMKRIQDKYKGKTDSESQAKMMKEIREVQKLHGVNPLGCGLSLIVQMPLFFFIVLPLINHYQARMVLSDAKFLWISSLAHPDIPLLVLYAISMFVSVRLSATPPADAQQAQMQKMTTLMSPMFALILWSYPSAFILYWFTYNALSTALQWRMMKASDPDKSAIKTIIGPMSAPAPALDAGGKTAGSDGAIPSRPSSASNKNNSNGKSTLASGDDGYSIALNGVSKNDTAKNEQNGAGEEDSQPEYASLQTHSGASVNGGGKSGSSGARRRRRRK